MLDSRHPRKASQSHQQGLLGVQAGRQVKSRTQRQGAGQRRRGGAQAAEQKRTEGVSPTSADGEHDIRDPYSQTGEEACATGRIRDGASRPKVQPMVLLPQSSKTTPLASVTAVLPHWSLTQSLTDFITQESSWTAA